MYTASKDDTVQGMKTSAKNIADNANDLVQSGKRDIRAIANDAGRKVRDAFNSASDEFTHASDTVTTHVRSNPVQSSLIALGLGFVIGAIFRRK